MSQILAAILLLAALTAAPAWACEVQCEAEETFTPRWGHAELFTVDVLSFRCVRQTGQSSFVRILWVDEYGEETLLASAPIVNPHYPFTMACYGAGTIYAYLEINEIQKLDVWH